MPGEPYDTLPQTSTVRGTTAQIRFGLSQLSARNGQFEFEALTRALARETVSRNILPATGPVGSGGDQGRDFESFATYLTQNIGALGRRSGITEGDGLAFACTLQSDALIAKIRGDVGKITGTGTPVEHVIYYCETNLPVARRHSLQAEIRRDFNVSLEVFDGEAIAELLAQRHLFWIAQEYLHLPAAALPPAPEQPGWYAADLDRWRSNDALPVTLGDLVDLSGCARFATYDDLACRDLPFWLERLGALLREGVAEPIRQKARYEIAVANLRGLGDLTPVEELVREFFAQAVLANDPNEISDASALLMYCVGARERSLTQLDEAQLKVWNDGLRRRCSDLLEQTRLPGRSCALLDTIGWLSVQPDLAAAQSTGTAYRADPSTIRMRPDEIRAMMQDLSSMAADSYLCIDREAAIDAWARMVELLPGAPLYPVERLGDLFRLLAPVLMVDRRYDDIVSAVDSRIAEVVGGSAAASNARDRAIAYYERGRLLDALREMNRARVGWLSGEATEPLVLASLFMSQIYRDLGLPAAAKHLALGAARFVGDTSLDLLARALLKAAEPTTTRGPGARRCCSLALVFMLTCSWRRMPTTSNATATSSTRCLSSR